MPIDSILQIFSSFCFPVAVAIWLLIADKKNNEKWNDTISKFNESNQKNNDEWHKMLEEQIEKSYSMLNENNEKWSKLIDDNTRAIDKLGNQMAGIESELKEIRDLRLRGDIR